MMSFSFSELGREAQKRAAKLFEPKIGYQLVGNPYVADVAAEVEDFLRTDKMEYLFTEEGALVVAMRKDY